MNAKANAVAPRILLVGLPHGLPNSDWVEFYTDRYFLDYNILIIDPLGALVGQRHDYTTKILDGVLSLGSREGAAFRSRISEFTLKLVDFVAKGGLAIVFLRSMPTLQYRSDDRYGESGRVSLDEFFPWGVDQIKRAEGNSIEFMTQGPIGRFWAETSELWSYEAVYKDPPKNRNLAHVRGHRDEVVADAFETKGRGFFLLTPIPRLGGRRGDREIAEERSSKFVLAAMDLHKALRTEGPAAELPGWVSDYSLPGEKELRAKISSAKEQIEAQEELIKQSTEELEELCLHKLLVTGHDSPLERAVDRVLTDLGLEVEPGPKGRVDRTAAYGDRKFAIEVQGVKKGAKEDHARSLTIWVNETALQDGKDPKGLLVVNPYRDTLLADRDGNNFWPGKTIAICERYGFCAITGVQLLGLYLDAQADDAKREQLVERLFSTNGLFKGYEDWSQFLAPAGSKASD